MDQDIKRAVDEQFAGKGLRRVAPQAWAIGNRRAAKSDLPGHSAVRLGGAEDEAMRQVALEQAAARYRADAPDNASWL